MKDYLFYFVICLVSVSCLPDPLPVNGIPGPDQTVVVGSQNLPNQFMVISVTESFNALDGGREDDYEELIQTLLVDSLELTVEVDDQLFVLQDTVPGVYFGADIPQIEGASYTLSFENPFNGLPVFASAELQPFVGFDSASIFIEVNEFDTLVNVSLQLDDPPGPNWYMVNVQLINEEFDFNVSPFTELFDDAGRDGELIDYDFRVFFRDYAEGDTVLVSMANISQEYYQFLDLRTTRRPFFGGLGEPINYPTNVENGLGYFHMHIPDVRLFLPGLGLVEQ